MSEGPTLNALVVFVRDIDRSAEFYTKLLGLEEVLREPQATMLASSAGPRLYLRAMKSAGRTSVNIGIQQAVWALPSEAELVRAESWLVECGAWDWKESYEGMTAVAGRDPDRLQVILHYPNEIGIRPSEIFRRIYEY